jgi:rhodanese-related sulfurtransferase
MILEISGEECAKLLERNNTTVLDVRSYAEYKSFRIPGAKHIDLLGQSVLDEFDRLDPSKRYLVYCAVGVRSKSAAKILEQMGFNEVYHLSDGILNYSGDKDETEL